MKRKIKHVLRRKREQFRQIGEADQLQSAVPRITNETVAAHREEVIGKARKYIYPLQHSKHRIVVLSSIIFITTVIGFFTFCTLALYRFQSSSTFIYRVSQVIPFPIARTGNHFIAYENYLFELRHFTHYYETQQKVDFSDPKNRPQLTEFKSRALEKVINDVYVKELAAKNGVTVSSQEIDNEIAIVRNQNRLGSSDKVLEDVLKDYWGWSINDFRRSLKQELLAQKLAAKLDTEARKKADAALAELRGGADFAKVAKKYSDDATTKDNNGEFGYLISQTTRDLPAETTDAILKLKPGQFSDILNVGYGLEIVKNIEMNGDKVRAAHILFNFKNITGPINDLRAKEKTRAYISVPVVKFDQ